MADRTGERRPPHVVAQRFVDAVWGRRALAEAFRWASPELAGCVAQSWLGTTGRRWAVGSDRDAVAARLAAADTAHPLWPRFAVAALDVLAERGDLADRDRWRWGSHTRVAGLDLEVLHLYDETQLVDGVVPLGGARGVVFLVQLRADRGWVVANLGSEELPVPGWPPRFE